MKRDTEIDLDYWKNRYKDSWVKASDRERRLISYLEEMTGSKITEFGLGTGSSDFISGSAESHGYTKGDADLKVEGSNIFIEVTGPLSKSVTEDKPLWFRPDKINNAARNIHTHNTFFAHHCPCTDLWRVIYVDKEFINRCKRKEFPVSIHTIRGANEKYVEIPYNDKCIHTLDFLLGYITAYKSIKGD